MFMADVRLLLRALIVVSTVGEKEFEMCMLSEISCRNDCAGQDNIDLGWVDKHI